MSNEEIDNFQDQLDFMKATSRDPAVRGLCKILYKVLESLAEKEPAKERRNFDPIRDRPKPNPPHVIPRGL